MSRGENARPAAGETLGRALLAAFPTRADAPPRACQVQNAGRAVSGAHLRVVEALSGGNLGPPAEFGGRPATWSGSGRRLRRVEGHGRGDCVQRRSRSRSRRRVWLPGLPAGSRHGAGGPHRLPRPDRRIRMDGGDSRPVDRRGGDGVRDRRLLHSVARQPAGHRRDAGGGDGRHGGSGGERRDLDTASELEPGRRDRRRGGGRRPDGNDPAARCFDCGHRRPRQPGGLDGRERGGNRTFPSRAHGGWRWPRCSCWSSWSSPGSGSVHSNRGRWAPEPVPRASSPFTARRPGPDQRPRLREWPPPHPGTRSSRRSRTPA